MIILLGPIYWKLNLVLCVILVEIITVKLSMQMRERGKNTEDISLISHFAVEIARSVSQILK